MQRSRVSAATIVVISAAWLASTPASAVQSPRLGASSSQPALSEAKVLSTVASYSGPTKSETFNLIDEPFLTETRRSYYSGSNGTQIATLQQEWSVNHFDDGGTTRVLSVDTETNTSTTSVPAKPNGGGAAVAQNTAYVTVQSEDFLGVTIEGTLRTSRAGGGCSESRLLIYESGGPEPAYSFTANTGPNCVGDHPSQLGVVEELQLLPGTAVFELETQNHSASGCIDSVCDPTFKGTTSWDLSIAFCSNSYTDGPDFVLGTPGRDVLCGGLGADEIHGLDGDDVVIGDAGDDIVIGGAGDDEIRGDGGNDELWGDTPDTCSNTAGGDDLLFPGRGKNDELHGCGGDDYFIEGSSFGVAAYGGPGLDVMVGGDGPDLFWGGPGGDLMAGRGGNDRLKGQGGNDDLQGQAGGDLTDGGAGERDRCRPGHHRDDRRVHCER